MESLLSLAFDNLSSFDGGKIKKGLKQVEGLLAQICLAGPSSPRKQSTQAARDREQPSGKGLADLSGDPAFREFFKLQEGFEWNIAQRLLTTLDWLVVRGGDGQYDLLIVNALDLIQGVLLLHPPSKVLFSRSINMNVSPPPPPPSDPSLLSHNPQTNPPLTRTAPPRPPRTNQLPSDPNRHHHHPRRRPPRQPAKRARL
jgi:hypothetical protein